MSHAKELVLLAIVYGSVVSVYGNPLTVGFVLMAIANTAVLYRDTDD